MRKITFLLIVIVAFISCEKPVPFEKEIPDGTYLGTFNRQFVWTDSDTAYITLTITGTHWSGSSDIKKYPALCNGTYSIIGDSINFENACEWTADFDWSLILSGKYLLIQSGDTIEFSKDYRSATSDTYVDIYKISKQE
jgi:hypothetical protein